MAKLQSLSVIAPIIRAEMDIYTVLYSHKSYMNKGLLPQMNDQAGLLPFPWIYLNTLAYMYYLSSYPFLFAFTTHLCLGDSYTNKKQDQKTKNPTGSNNGKHVRQWLRAQA